MPRQDEIDWDNLLFTKPAEAVDQIVAKARRIIHQDYNDLTRRERWEKGFYRDYPALASHPELVEEVKEQVRTHMPPSTTIGQANALIAMNVEAKLKHRKRFDRVDEERAMWSGGPGFDGPQPPTPQDQGQTLGDTLNARRERRRGQRSSRVLSGDHI